MCVWGGVVLIFKSSRISHFTLVFKKESRLLGRGEFYPRQPPGSRPAMYFLALRYKYISSCSCSGPPSGPLTCPAIFGHVLLLFHGIFWSLASQPARGITWHVLMVCPAASYFTLSVPVSSET